MDYELFSRPAILAPAVLALSYIIYQIFFKPSPISKLKLPIVGARPGDWFPYSQAKWRNFVNFRSAALEADRLSREANPSNPHQAVFLPVLGYIPNLVQLPRSEIQFLIDQPDPILNMHDQVLDTLQLDYVLSDPHLVHQPLHHKIITTTLTSQIGNLVPDVADETAWAFNHVWDVASGQSKDVVVYDTLRRVISGVTNRVFLGTPLCRDEELLDIGLSYANLMPITGQVLAWFSGPIKSIISVFLTLPLKVKYRRFCKLLRPEVKRRLAEYDARQADPEKPTLPKRNDFLEWCINQAKPSGDPYLYSPDTLAGRIILVNFAGIHTTSFAITHALLDLVYSPNKDQIIAELREEIEACLEKYGEPEPGKRKKWNKASLNAMHKLDSLLRESARLNSLVTIGLARKVAAKDGLVTPHSKIRLPKGTVVVVPAYPVMRDGEKYPAPEEFRPFRFSDLRADESKEYVKRAGKAFATTGGDYLAFGHGRNACPGRFFVSNELKIVLGWIVLNYELEGVDGQVGRPENKWYGVNVVPDFGARIRISRRDNVGG
ncbi:cytochrome P450 [Rhypophila decipiens]|uniref:Cytochrome P450 n=1 Tax=Rhypophila decipiens TaxID=261697 RepID=A0AAN6XS53_9PEZI|nr:cytochrome P450 [Rhypophila decipiens]